MGNTFYPIEYQKYNTAYSKLNYINYLSKENPENEKLIEIFKSFVLSEKFIKIRKKIISRIMELYPNKIYFILKKTFSNVFYDTGLLEILKDQLIILKPDKKSNINSKFKEKLEKITAFILEEMFEKKEISQLSHVYFSNPETREICSKFMLDCNQNFQKIYETHKNKNNDLKNTFEFLHENFDYDYNWDYFLQKFNKQPINLYRRYSEIPDVYLNHLKKCNTLIGQIEIVNSLYTYNFDSLMDRDFILTHFKIKKKEYAIISIHLEGDARYNFSLPHIFKFKANSDDFYIELINNQ